MTDLFDYIQTQKNEGGTVLGSYTVTDINMVAPKPQAFLFTAEGTGKRKDRLMTIAIKEADGSDGDSYEVNVTDTNAAKTFSYAALSRQAVEQFLQTGLMPNADEPF
jgi:hypothetical protein